MPLPHSEYKMEARISPNKYVKIKFGDTGRMQYEWLLSKNAVVINGNTATPAIVYYWNHDGRPCAYEPISPSVSVQRSMCRRHEDHAELVTCVVDVLSQWCEDIGGKIGSRRPFSGVYLFPDDFISMKLPEGTPIPMGLIYTSHYWIKEEE